MSADTLNLHHGETEVEQHKPATVFGIEPSFIGFCGAGGTGKTTTAVNLAARRGIPMLASASRRVFQRFGVEREDDQDYMTGEQRWALQHSIQEAHWRQQFQVAIKYNGNVPIVCDRTQWDQFAYAMLQCADTMTEERYNWLRGLAIASTSFYTHIFYFPLVTFGQDSLADGMRTQNWGMRNKFDMLLRSLLKEFNVKAVEVPVGSIDERVRFIASRVEFFGPELDPKEIKQVEMATSEDIDAPEAAMVLRRPRAGAGAGTGTSDVAATSVASPASASTIGQVATPAGLPSKSVRLADLGGNIPPVIDTSKEPLAPQRRDDLPPKPPKDVLDWLKDEPSVGFRATQTERK
jgi:predicted ATPase